MGEIELGLRRLATRYLAGEVQLAVVHAWIAAEAWNIDARADAGVAQLYHDVELLLAEHGHGDWTEDELKDRLAPIARYMALIEMPGFVQLTTPNNVGRRVLQLAPANPTRIPSLGSLTPALAS
ncbi:MAG: hypothetical protein Q7W02_06395 [Candidatus Rokubacteria bacterium]|nr:hypothetical protein [Candidatus Rokubacteria bacterium]